MEIKDLKDKIELLSKAYYLSPSSLVQAFGEPESNQFIKNIIKKFNTFFKSVNSVKKELLFSEWEKIFKISEEFKTDEKEAEKRKKALSKIFDEEITNEAEALFVLHNVLSIIIKLLIYNNFSKLKLVDEFEGIENLKNFMKKLETGEFFNNLGIYNLTTYDYFSWYVENDIEWDKNIHEVIYNLIQKVNSFIPLTNIESPVDYVEELYRSYIPKEVRYSLGEFFTPPIIAREVVKEIAKVKPYDKVIDPTCGSGTFLIESLKVKKQADLSIKDIFETICGIDLNPINVLLTKFNIITNLLDKIKECKISNLVVPVFIGDSSYMSITTASYDKVIGNPPWIRWSNLPLNYRKKVKKALKEEGLFSSDRNTGGIDLNVYAIITYNALKNLLKKDGTLTFLLPKSSLQNKSLEGFRKLCMDKYGEIVEPIYFSKGKIFEEVNLDFVILTLKKK